MFLQYILKRKKDDLLLRFFNAQNREPSRNDWANTVKNDLNEFGLDFSFEEIKSFSKFMWLKKVKKACKIFAFENLLEAQLEYSKGSNLGYGSLKSRSYLKSAKINANQAKTIFRIRTRMLKVKNNFKNGSVNTKCPICKNGEDSQEHVFIECKMLGERLSKKEYFSIFSENEEEMANVIMKIEKILNLYNSLTEDIT